MPRKGEGYYQQQGYKHSPHRGRYGNDPSYLASRINRDRPDIASDTAAGKYASMRQAAIAAGIIREAHPDDKILVELIRLWQRADEATRALFDAVREEIDAAPARAPIRGPAPILSPSAPVELVKAAEHMSLAEIARRVGVSRNTVGRWASGESSPRKAALARLSGLTSEEQT